MRISKVEPIVLRVPLDRPVRTSFGSMTSRVTVLVRIETDTGEFGIGEIWNNFPSWGVYEKLATLKYGVEPLLIGEDPRDIMKINEKLFYSLTVLGLQWGALGPIYHSISGVDIALWDLSGKLQGKSVAQLLGAVGDQEIGVYASGLGPGPFEDLVAQHQQLGVTAFKLKVGTNEDADYTNLQQLRSMLKPTDTVMIDANQAWSRQDAVRILNRLKSFDLAWIEEPLRCDDLEGPHWVREQTGMPIAGGENMYGRHHTKMVLEKNGLDFLQPDMSKNGGITEAKAMVELAGSKGVPFAPHFLGGAVCLAASIHFIAGIPGGVLLELDANPNPLREKLFTKPITIKEGKIQVPDGPGLGFELDQDFVDFYNIKLEGLE